MFCNNWKDLSRWQLRFNQQEEILPFLEVSGETDQRFEFRGSIVIDEISKWYQKKTERMYLLKAWLYLRSISQFWNKAIKGSVLRRWVFPCDMMLFLVPSTLWGKTKHWYLPDIISWQPFDILHMSKFIDIQNYVKLTKFRSTACNF